ncbi:hypothetical protein KEM56_003559 [Ascosphaera pollenicola]|nr:hypothetical protein KEM56_003559 [Ascosphaera pollenicola]
MSRPRPTHFVCLPPRESDVDAMAAHQLHQETLSASSTPHNLKRPKISIRALEAKTRRPHAHTSSPSATAKPQPQQQQHAADGLHSVIIQSSSSQQQQQPDIPTQQTQTPAPPADSKPFTSFYSQPHIRDIALGKTKASRRSRSRLAFGQPVPDLPEQDFELPAGMLTDEAINAAQRKLRRLRRQK